MEYLIFLGSILITYPIVTFLLIKILSKKITKKNKLSTQIAIDASSIFFIISVYYLILEVFNKDILFYLLLFILIIGLIVVLLQWKIREEIKFINVVKSVLRMNFIIFFIMHIILLGYGLFEYVNSYINS
ncbi:MAG: hypothetical protein K0S51_559 [Bacillales bacterium]|jgi:hypothetical protein|nr:hypothetical protein [Bacillales bacterium]